MSLKNRHSAIKGIVLIKDLSGCEVEDYSKYSNLAKEKLKQIKR